MLNPKGDEGDAKDRRSAGDGLLSLSNRFVPHHLEVGHGKEKYEDEKGAEKRGSQK